MPKFNFASLESKKEPEVKITLGEKVSVSKSKLKAIDADFNIKQFLTEMATESEFERLIYKALFGKVARGSNEVIESKLEEGIKKFRVLVV